MFSFSLADDWARLFLCYSSGTRAHWPAQMIPFMEFWMLSVDLIRPIINTSPNVDGVALFLRKFGRMPRALEALLNR
jgi:hypothetical protein